MWHLFAWTARRIQEIGGARAPCFRFALLDLVKVKLGLKGQAPSSWSARVNSGSLNLGGACDLHGQVAVGDSTWCIELKAPGGWALQGPLLSSHCQALASEESLWRKSAAFTFNSASCEVCKQLRVTSAVVRALVPQA